MKVGSVEPAGGFERATDSSRTLYGICGIRDYIAELNVHINPRIPLIKVNYNRFDFICMMASNGRNVPLYLFYCSLVMSVYFVSIHFLHLFLEAIEFL